MKSFSPFTTYSLPSSRASVRRAVRSDPAHGSVRANARQPLATSQPRQEPLPLLGSSERADRIDRADAAVHRGQAGHGRIDHRHAREKRGETGKRRSAATIGFVDQQAPIAGRAELGKDRVGYFSGGIQQGAGLTMPTDDVDRIVHHALDFGGRFRRFAGKQIDRQAALPNGAMDRAIDGLVTRREQRFDLIVRFVDRAGAACLVLAFAPHLERRFGERGFAVGC